jgi:DNA polymerase I-like protein with 3'-5' exonuclease and polymerase domains
MKDLKRFIAETEREVKRTGFAWTWWDGQRARRRPLWQIATTGEEASKARGNAERGAFNTAVQGTANEFNIASCIEMVDWLRRTPIRAELIMTVHDELIFHVRNDFVDTVARKAYEVMTGWNSGPVPLDVDIEIGPSWGETEEYVI